LKTRLHVVPSLQAADKQEKKTVSTTQPTEQLQTKGPPRPKSTQKELRQININCSVNSRQQSFVSPSNTAAPVCEFVKSSRIITAEKHSRRAVLRSSHKSSSPPAEVISKR